MRAVPALRGAWRLSPAAAGLVPGGGTRVGCVPLTAPMGTLDAGTAPEYTSSRLTYGAAAGWPVFFVYCPFLNDHVDRAKWDRRYSAST